MRFFISFLAAWTSIAVAGEPDSRESLSGELCLHACALVGEVRATLGPHDGRGELVVDDRMRFSMRVGTFEDGQTWMRLHNAEADAETTCWWTDGRVLDCDGELFGPDGAALSFTLTLTVDSTQIQ